MFSQRFRKKKSLTALIGISPNPHEKCRQVDKFTRRVTRISLLQLFETEEGKRTAYSQKKIGLKMNFYFSRTNK